MSPMEVHSDRWAFALFISTFAMDIAPFNNSMSSSVYRYVAASPDELPVGELAPSSIIYSALSNASLTLAS